MTTQVQVERCRVRITSPATRPTDASVDDSSVVGLVRRILTDDKLFL